MKDVLFKLKNSVQPNYLLMKKKIVVLQHSLCKFTYMYVYVITAEVLERVIKIKN